MLLFDNICGNEIVRDEVEAVKKLYFLLISLYFSVILFSGCDFNNSLFGCESQQEDKVEENIEDNIEDNIIEEEIPIVINTNPADGAYNENTHTFSLYNMDNDKICELRMPKDCEMYYDKGDGMCYTIFTYVNGVSYMDIRGFITGGFKTINLDGVPYEKLYDSYTCDYEWIEDGDVKFYKIHEQSAQGGEKVTQLYYILVPYIDRDGEEQFFSIELDDGFYWSWDSGAEKVIIYMLRHAYDANHDSLIEIKTEKK